MKKLSLEDFETESIQTNYLKAIKGGTDVPPGGCTCDSPAGSTAHFSYKYTMGMEIYGAQIIILSNSYTMSGSLLVT